MEYIAILFVAFVLPAAIAGYVVVKVANAIAKVLSSPRRRKK